MKSGINIILLAAALAITTVSSGMAVERKPISGNRPVATKSTSAVPLTESECNEQNGRVVVDVEHICGAGSTSMCVVTGQDGKQHAVCIDNVKKQKQ